MTQATECTPGKWDGLSHRPLSVIWKGGLVTMQALPGEQSWKESLPQAMPIVGASSISLSGKELGDWIRRCCGLLL